MARTRSHLQMGFWEQLNKWAIYRVQQHQEAILTSWFEKGKEGIDPAEGYRQGVGAALQGLHSRDQPLPGKGDKPRQGGGGGRHISWPLFTPVLWVLHTPPNPTGSKRAKELKQEGKGQWKGRHGPHGIRCKVTIGLPNLSGPFTLHGLQLPYSGLLNHYPMLHLDYGCSTVKQS